MTSAVGTEREVHLKQYFRILTKHRWLIAGVFLLTALSGALWTFSQTPIYEVGARVLIEPEPPRVLNIQDVTPIGSSGGDYYQTQYEIIRSRAVAEKVIETTNIKQRHPAVASPGAIQAGLTVEPVRGTRLVMVKFRHPDANVAVSVANAVANTYVRHNLDLKLKGARDALSWLNEQMASLKGKVQESAAALQNYRVKAGILGMQEQRQITTAKIMDFNKAYLEAQAQRLSIEAKLREITRIAKERGGAQTLYGVADNLLIGKLRSEASDLEIQRSRLLQTYKEKHPEVLKLDAQLAEVNRKHEAQIHTMLKAVQTEYDVAKAREETLLRNVNQLKQEAQELNEKEIQYLTLQRENESVQHLYDAVLKRLKETGVSGGIEANNMRVVEEAVVPGAPVWPRKTRDVSIASVLGLVLGVGLAVVIEYFDTTVKSPDDVERYLGLPVIAIVPAFTGKQ